jgi:RNA polymerase sigma-70 factor, ECF subfamily
VNDRVSPVDLLRSAQAGDRAALDRLLPLVYDELKRVARNRMRNEKTDHTLQATALVHEAYLKLIDQHSTDWDQRAQFFSIASEVMRRVLVNHAVAQQTEKRGGKWSQVTVSLLNDIPGETTDADAAVIDLDRALTDLAALDPQQARVVELRYFGGLTIEETAAAMNLSIATVKREWSTARLWLKRALEAGRNEP